MNRIIAMHFIWFTFIDCSTLELTDQKEMYLQRNNTMGKFWFSSPDATYQTWVRYYLKIFRDWEDKNES